MPNRNQAIRFMLQDQLPLYMFISVIIAAGIVFGAVMTGALTLDQKQEIHRHLGSFIQSLNQSAEADSAGSFREFFGINVKWVLLIWLLGMSVIGLPLIFILDFIKGVLIGFTVGFLAGQYTWSGFWFALVSVVPQNLVIVPVIVISSAAATGFTAVLVKQRFLMRAGSVYHAFMRYSLLTLAMVGGMAGISALEAFFSTDLMRRVIPMLTGLF